MMLNKRLKQHGLTCTLLMLTFLANILFTQPAFDTQNPQCFTEYDAACQLMDDLIESNENLSEYDNTPDFLFTVLAVRIQLQARQRTTLTLPPLFPDIVSFSLSERGPPFKHS